MENKQYRCSMTPFICSIVPIGAAGFIGLLALAFPNIFRQGGDFPGGMDVLKSIFPCFSLPLVALVMVPMGIYSGISGMAEIRVPRARGKTLVSVAIVLGILDIAAGAGFLLYLFSIFSRVF
jgi:hypothetical protein